MHIHISRPTAASTAALTTTILVTALIGCAEWEMQTRAEAAQHFADQGEYARALLSMLPIPWAMPAAGLVAIAGHIAATVLRRGKKPEKNSGESGPPADPPLAA